MPQITLVVLEESGEQVLEISNKPEQTLELVNSSITSTLTQVASPVILEVLKGQRGQDGVTGSKWFTGAGVPSGSLAGTSINDFYLNTSNGDVYQKTGATTWLLVGNILGPPGADGADVIVNHGSDANAARPSAPTSILWTGTVSPNNSIDGDRWLHTTTGSEQIKVAGSFVTINSAFVASSISTHESASNPHPIYLTAAEGDAAYDALGAAASSVATHEAASNPHPVYLTQSEGDAAYDALGAAASSVSTHEAASNPHPVYLTAAEGDAAYEPIGTAAAGDANLVAKATYDANSILYATTDNTPVALTIAASRIVGRKASGDISAMTASELWAILAAGSGHPEVIMVAVSDESTALTTGTAKVTFRMPFAFTLTQVKASLTIASTSGAPAIDLNEDGVSVFSTTLTIDANEKTSATAATPAVISDASIADDAEMTIDIDTAGTGAKGLKIYLIGTRA